MRSDRFTLTGQLTLNENDRKSSGAEMQNWMNTEEKLFSSFDDKQSKKFLSVSRKTTGLTNGSTLPKSQIMGPMAPPPSILKFMPAVKRVSPKRLFFTNVGQHESTQDSTSDIMSHARNISRINGYLQSRNGQRRTNALGHLHHRNPNTLLSPRAARQFENEIARLPSNLSIGDSTASSPMRGLTTPRHIESASFTMHLRHLRQEPDLEKDEDEEPQAFIMSFVVDLQASRAIYQREPSNE